MVSFFMKLTVLILKQFTVKSQVCIFYIMYFLIFSINGGSAAASDYHRDSLKHHSAS
jgi:hypothetical protein